MFDLHQTNGVIPIAETKILTRKSFGNIYWPFYPVPSVIG